MVAGIGRGKEISLVPAAEGLIRPGVDHADDGAVGQVAEVHQHVGALGVAHEQRLLRGPGGLRCDAFLCLAGDTDILAVARQRRGKAGLDTHYLGQQALLRADLVEGQPGASLRTVGPLRL